MRSFDTSGAAEAGSGLFGLPSEPLEAAIHIIQVPFDATTSYGQGASAAPPEVVRASHQVELFHADAGAFWERGIVLLPPNGSIAEWNERAAESVRIARGDAAQSKEATERVNAISADVDSCVRGQARRALDDGRQVGLLGGDHATALGLIEEVASRQNDLGILWIDAHHDLRSAYEGFERSHASVLFNVLERCPSVSRVVQVGVRDYCAEEQNRVAASDGRVVVHTDESLANDSMRGLSFSDRIDEIVDSLPQDVYISFDVDGLEPSLCPGTGTPVPGGLSYNQAVSILRAVVRSNRRVVGFDLVEVAIGNTRIDAIVGARLLFELCAQLSLSFDSAGPEDD